VESGVQGMGLVFLVYLGISEKKLDEKNKNKSKKQKTFVGLRSFWVELK